MPAGRGFGLVVPDKARLDHARFDQSHDDWYRESLKIRRFGARPYRKSGANFSR
jgi:hypothetical protein